mmetsp:Transcript_43003/g.107454  ORF Transcript_43003/g.107454 Transcript_43003/m.107454 type:complete len:123 (-) Transcript_43003:1576-1944(-)
MNGHAVTLSVRRGLDRSVNLSGSCVSPHRRCQYEYLSELQKERDEIMAERDDCKKRMEQAEAELAKWRPLNKAARRMEDELPILLPLGFLWHVSSLSLFFSVVRGAVCPADPGDVLDGMPPA